jgi:opacity protein-like surface antigen
VKFRNVFFLLFALGAMTVSSSAQLEASGYYTHLTGNFGLDGFSGGVGYQFNRHVTLVGDADFLWDTSRIGVLDLTPQVGATSVKSNEQNYLGGARIRIIGWKPMRALEKRKILPFAEVFFGVSRLHQEVKDTAGTISADASDTAFTWLVGGGVDYTLSSKWLARGNLDFVRTHFVDQGQSRLRFRAGLAYVF